MVPQHPDGAEVGRAVLSAPPRFCGVWVADGGVRTARPTHYGSWKGARRERGVHAAEGWQEKCVRKSVDSRAFLLPEGRAPCRWLPFVLKL